MTVIEKVDYLLKCLNLSERQFAKKYRIRKNVISKWRNNEVSPKPENVRFLCDKFGFSVEDFLNDESTLAFSHKYADEHRILGKIKVNDAQFNNEDFPNEDNPRYEEKD